MSIIDDIKKARQNSLSEENKKKLLTVLKERLTRDECAIIGCGSHFPNPKWKFDMWGIEVPYSERAAVKDFLKNEGFYCRDYINGFGVNYGLEVFV